ncbi:hypothetical protein KIK06_26730 [Nocardiopsis sp. EMB25]|uniref:hypothetical protein n=1 Tax=Nocardiopsis TaxID=2013 RepID=UPI00034DC441|nr:MULTISPECIES: hypothetical protein [Nocardiopsis]MCY9787482.1 hypothetical protein [Nocardiopsis sp. EMB25]
MKRALLSGIALVLLTACGEQVATPREPEGGGTSPDDGGTPNSGDADGGTHVFNRHGDAEGYPDQEPRDYVATEFTTFTRMNWEDWSEGTARGHGELSGTWCFEQGCVDDPYEVDVELSDPKEVDGTAYFSTYTISDPAGDMPADAREAMEAADGGRLDLPPEE